MINLVFSAILGDFVKKSEFRSRLDSVFINTAYPPVPYVAPIGDYVSDSQLGTDNTARFQAIVDYIMNSGGGIMYTPPGKYRFEGTLYSHNSTLDSSKKNNRLTILGYTPVSATNVSTRTVFIKKNSGVIIACNYNTSDPISCVDYPSLYDRLTVKNIAFSGGGTPHPKYSFELSSTNGSIGIEAHFARLTIKGCSFWGLEYGVYEPETIEGCKDTNYCDWGIFKDLSFSCIGTGCMNIVHGENSKVRNISFVGGVSGVRYVIDIYLGMSMSIKNIICSGYPLLRCTSLNIVKVRNSRSINVGEIYLENITNTPVYIYSSRGVEIENMYIRHRAPTYGAHFIAIDSCIGVTLKNLTGFFVETLQLNETNDNGHYTNYDTVTATMDVIVANSVSQSSEIKCYNSNVQPGQYVNGSLQFLGSARRLTGNPSNITFARNVRSTSLVVAAPNSLGYWLADYICDGTSDQTEINQAISFLASTGGGKVTLLDGTYTVSGNITLDSRVTLEGQGYGTVIKIVDGRNADVNVIYAGSSKTLAQVKNLTLDGNKTNNSSGTQSGVKLDSGSSNITVENIEVKNFRNNGFTLAVCNGNRIERCKLHNNDSSGIYTYQVTACKIIDNECYSNKLSGIHLSTISQYNIVKKNHCYLNEQRGIYLSASDDNNVWNNVCKENSQYADDTYSNIYLDTDASKNNIQGNMCRMGAHTNKPKYGILVSGSGCINNFVTNNDLLDGGYTANFYDSGTGTITTAGNRT